jgi:molybdopterin/thiamine biosynthesis adenylyltransferase
VESAGGAPEAGLREDQIQRYARHVLLPDVGGRGQRRLLAAQVEVELGPGRAAEATALAYLAAAGVGRLFLTGDIEGPVADDEIAGSVLYGAADRGRPRGRAAAERIAALNPDVEVVAGQAAGALRLSDVLAAPDASALALGPGAALADGLVRAGAAASRLLMRIASTEPS